MFYTPLHLCNHLKPLKFLSKIVTQTVRVSELLIRWYSLVELRQYRPNVYVQVRTGETPLGEIIAARRISVLP